MSISGGIIRLNISKDMEDLNSTINQPDLIDIHKSHLTTADHTFCFPDAMAYLPKYNIFCSIKQIQAYFQGLKSYKMYILIQLYPTLCGPKYCNLLDSSVHGIFQARIVEWLSFPTPGDLPNPVIEPESLTSPALARGIFTTLTIWEAPYSDYK